MTEAKRLAWIARRNAIYELLRLLGVSIFRRCDIANRVMGWFGPAPRYEDMERGQK